MSSAADLDCPETIQAPPDIDLGDDPAEVIRLGQEALRRIERREVWEDWRLVGLALKAGKDETIRQHGFNRAIGHAWSEVWGRWLEDAGFSDIDSAVRSRLENLIDDLDGVEAWRATLTDEERAKWSHPSTVWRHYQAAREARRAEALANVGAAAPVELDGADDDDRVKPGNTGNSDAGIAPGAEAPADHCTNGGDLQDTGVGSDDDGDLRQRYQQLARMVMERQARVDHLNQTNQRLRAENATLRAENERLLAENRRLAARLAPVVGRPFLALTGGGG